MNLADVYPDTHPFLKAADLGDGQHTVTIRAIGSFEFEGANKLTLSLTRGDGVPVDQDLVLNKTNARAVGDAYGREGIDLAWIGKEIVIYAGPTGMGPGIHVRVPTSNGVAAEALGPQVSRTEQMRGRPVDEPPF